MNRVSLLRAIVVCWAASAVCASCIDARVGESCSQLSDCLPEGQECVRSSLGGGTCLPSPSPPRPVQSCSTADECEAWPVEAVCGDDLCRCPTRVEACQQDPDEVFEEETCSCVPIGGPGARCQSSFTCGEDLGCVDNACAPASDLGVTCRLDAECTSGTCVRREAGPVGALGVCR